MTLYKYENNAADTLNGSIDASQITITLNDASEFPVIGVGEAYWITVTDGVNLEIMLVTDDASTPTLTVTRGQQGTSGTAFADASPVAQRLTKGFFEDVLQADESPEIRGTLTAPTGTGIDAENADSLKVPTSATFAPVATGEVGIDDTVTDWSHGVMQYYSGEAVGVVAMPIAQFTSPTDGYVVAYNATNDEFELVAQSGGGGGDLVDDLTPQLGGFLDLNGNFIGHATSGATAYSIVSDGTGLATYGANANYVHAFTNSGWSIQWGTSFNRMEFDISTDMRVYTNNILRLTINDSGLTLGATTAVSGILDEDTMSSDSATDLATQQSIKAYVDTSVGSPDWELISSATASSSSAITFTGLSSTYFMYVVVMADIIPATDNTILRLRTSTDGGTTYDSGASDYSWAASINFVSSGDVPGVSNEGNFNDTSITLQAANGTVAGETTSGILYLFNVAGTNFTYCNYDMMATNSFGTVARYPGGGVRQSAADVDAIEFTLSSGNITSGEFKLYGVRGA